jgi:hypothetical protein
MALGAISNSWVSDVLFDSRRFVAIIVYMVIAALVALALSQAAPGGVPSLVLMFMCGFFVFGPASSFWALCPDLFGRRLSGAATGVLNCWSYACAGLGEPMIGRLMDVTGDTGLIFPLVAGLCAAGGSAPHSFPREDHIVAGRRIAGSEARGARFVDVVLTMSIPISHLQHIWDWMARAAISLGRQQPPGLRRLSSASIAQTFMGGGAPGKLPLPRPLTIGERS